MDQFSLRKVPVTRPPTCPNGYGPNWVSNQRTSAGVARSSRRFARWVAGLKVRETAYVGLHFPSSNANRKLPAANSVA
jgi:hypothetical protein